MKKPSPATFKNHKGFGLLETLLTIGALSALSIGIYMVLSPTSASAQAKAEQDNLRDLSTAIEASFGMLGGYQGISASRVKDDGLVPQRMVGSGVMLTEWGSAVTVAPTSIHAPNDGFVITYPATPSDVCSRLAAAVSNQVFDLRVDGASVMRDGTSVQPSPPVLVVRPTLPRWNLFTIRAWWPAPPSQPHRWYCLLPTHRWLLPPVHRWVGPWVLPVRWALPGRWGR